MKKSIIIDGKSVEYELVLKNVKNINLRIHRDGKITVSAHKKVPLEIIENFLIQKSDFITKALKKFSNSADESAAVNFEDGAFLLLFGKRYEIKNEISSRNFVKLEDGNKAIIFTRDKSIESKKKAVLSLYNKACESEITEMCKDAYKSFGHIVPTMPQIKFRKEKGRWGTCYSKENKIILNKLLAAAPIDCIKYVIYHEFVHFIHPNHSENFYKELKKYVPNYKELKSVLNDCFQEL